MHTGYVYKLLNDIYAYLGEDDSFAETKQRIIRIRLSLKTGLSMNKFTSTSDDSRDEIIKILEILKSPEFSLAGFPFEQYQV